MTTSLQQQETVVRLADGDMTFPAGCRTAVMGSSCSEKSTLLRCASGERVTAGHVWRMEHRGIKWNLLLTATRQSIMLMLATVAVRARVLD